jgi:hypothetical protein
MNNNERAIWELERAKEHNGRKEISDANRHIERAIGWLNPNKYSMLPGLYCEHTCHPPKDYYKED